ncbi:MAG: metalloprotease TldD [Gammaproteobacteria bacterium]|nr:metalloprotease TldD [Gammaproteobacteria bacterium]MDE0281829.1 metalloprotease TldD [Gammaproteobacteria bacterium]MDE0714405.1 metalloprotease TldD [Gammaproteobacteria bacterium]MXY64698.1 metalloprotease TldD [Gammaproteobacteria bacterium]MYG68134.1 metalloprotease TldD [Gammaproteobacteria bacterium]
MTELIQLAQQSLWQPTGLVEQDISRTLGRIMVPGVDYADLYFQYTRHESWSLDEGTVKSGNYNIDQGVGVRAVAGEKTGFAYSDEITGPALLDAAGAARAIATGSSRSGAVAVRRKDGLTPLYQPLDPLDTLTESAKVDLLRNTEQLARELDPRVIQVMVGLAGVHDTVLVARSDGVMAADVRPLVRLSVTVVAEQDGRRERGSAGGGGRFGMDWFLEADRAAEYARMAVRQALVNLEARDAPAGDMAVVLGPGWPGILLHEAIGHGLEGDFNRKGTSAFSGRIGERVASEQCTVVDDGTIPDRRGSMTIDDEGEPGQNTVLIENGILKEYMQDQMNARLMGMRPTGNGRRESYAHLPMPRMTNTYMLAGEHDPGEIIASVDKGVYAVNFDGGQVDITSGKFVFSASEAYLIENGRVTSPIKGVTLIGNGPEVLTRVSMVGNDLELDTGVGTCGKEGQSVPVGVGQPTMRIDRLTVGGVAVS